VRVGPISYWDSVHRVTRVQNAMPCLVVGMSWHARTGPGYVDHVKPRSGRVDRWLRKSNGTRWRVRWVTPC
jgi:hypothetical protein